MDPGECACAASRHWHRTKSASCDRRSCRAKDSRYPASDSSKQEGLVWGDWCQGLSLLAISLLGRAATSPRPDLVFAKLLRGAAVKGGRRPSRSDLPLTAAST